MEASLSAGGGNWSQSKGGKGAGVVGKDIEMGSGGQSGEPRVCRV